MASFNQVPLGQTSIAIPFTNAVFGSQLGSPSFIADKSPFRLTGNLGQRAVYPVIIDVQPRWRRESKMIGGSS